MYTTYCIFINIYPIYCIFINIYIFTEDQGATTKVKNAKKQWRFYEIRPSLYETFYKLLQTILRRCREHCTQVIRIYGDQSLILMPGSFQKKTK